MWKQVPSAWSKVITIDASLALFQGPLSPNSSYLGHEEKRVARRQVNRNQRETNGNAGQHPKATDLLLRLGKTPTNTSLVKPILSKPKHLRLLGRARRAADLSSRRACPESGRPEPRPRLARRTRPHCEHPRRSPGPGGALTLARNALALALVRSGNSVRDRGRTHGTETKATIILG